jgi:hypothetical protein
LGHPKGRLCSRRWEGNIKREVKEIGCDDVNWIKMAYHGSTDRIGEYGQNAGVVDD